MQRRDGVVTITLNRPASTQRHHMADVARPRGHLPRHRRSRHRPGGGRSPAPATPSARAPTSATSPTPVTISARMRMVGDTCLALHRLPQPTIARVNGVAVGAGLNLALGCDLVVASRPARFSEIFTRRGLTVDFGGTWVLPRLIGMQRAKELVLLAEMIDADRAERIGLVNKVVEPSRSGRGRRRLGRTAGQRSADRHGHEQGPAEQRVRVVVGPGASMTRLAPRRSTSGRATPPRRSRRSSRSAGRPFAAGSPGCGGPRRRRHRSICVTPPTYSLVADRWPASLAFLHPTAPGLAGEEEVRACHHRIRHPAWRRRPTGHRRGPRLQRLAGVHGDRPARCLVPRGARPCPGRACCRAGCPGRSGASPSTWRPSGVRKAGSGLDLAIAVGVLIADEELPAEAVRDLSFLGELGLDGTVRPVPGAVPLVDALTAPVAVVPLASASQARLVGRHRVQPVTSLVQVVNALRGDDDWPELDVPSSEPGPRVLARPGRRPWPTVRSSSARVGGRRRASPVAGRAAGSGQDDAGQAAARSAARPRSRPGHASHRGCTRPPVERCRRAGSSSGPRSERPITAPASCRWWAAAPTPCGPARSAWPPAACSSSTSSASSSPPHSTRFASPWRKAWCGSAGPGSVSASLRSSCSWRP